MKQKQYVDMTVIMGLCRTFCDQIQRAMKNCGLEQEGYSLRIRICNEDYGDDFVLLDDIELEKSILSTEREEWDKTRMNQLKTKGRGWFVYADPLTEIGDLPPEVRTIKRERTFPCGKAEDGGKPYPVDGLWIGDFNHDSDVGGGR